MGEPIRCEVYVGEKPQIHEVKGNEGSISILPSFPPFLLIDAHMIVFKCNLLPCVFLE